MAQNIVGRWKTIDDETKKERSVVEIYEKNGKFYGKILKVFWDKGEDDSKVCDKCTDNRKDKKIIGMDIILDMVKDGDEYVDGTILDPKKGKVYTCKMWIEQGKLQVRGYIAFLFRTQTWYKYDN